MTLAGVHVADRTASARGWIALVLLAFLAFLPAFAALPVMDRDEARYVQASRQMVESGDYVDIRFQDEARHKKPVGIYWLQSAAVIASGQGPDADLWVYRLPSLAGAVLAVLLVAVTGVPLIGQGPALMAAALFAAGFGIGGEARIGKTDAALLATILASQAVLARLYMRQATGQGMAYAFWLAMAAGILLKGPIGPLVPVLTAGTLGAIDRRGGWLRPLLAPLPIVLALMVTLPWFIAITLRSDGAFWSASVGTDLLPKIASGQEGKGAPPGSYLAMLWFAFWPATPLLVLALPVIWRNRREPATRFCLAWALPVWVLYELVPTKLIHYTLPVFPALALLAVGHLPSALTTANRWLAALAGFAILPGFALVAVVLFHARSSETGPTAFWLAAAGLAGATLATGFGLRAFSAERPRLLAGSAAAAGVILHAGLFSAMARMPMLWPTDQAMARAEAIAASQACETPEVTGWGYQEPSLVWRAGRETRLFPASAPAADVIRPGPCAVVVRSIRSDAPRPAPIPGCENAGLVEGLAMGAGRWVTLDILDCRAAP